MKIRKFIILWVVISSTLLPIGISNKISSNERLLFESPSSKPQITYNKDNKTIILMIGDGMDHEHLKLAKWVEIGKNNCFSFELVPIIDNVTTYSADNSVTDSAAAATAIATGYKTNNGYLSILPSLISVQTILEMAQEKGKSSGIVSTTEVTHATPAAFMTHVTSRSQTSEIARQIVEESGVDIIMGGGKVYFNSQQINQMQMNGYQIVENKTGLQSISSGKLFGLFADSHLPYEIDRDYSLTPSLADMTDKAIELLSQDPDGFFLMVEGGKIDHAGHANNKVNVALETIEFYYAIERAITFVKNTKNCLLIITADHETGGLLILGDNLNSTLPSQSNTPEENEFLRIKRSENISVSWSTTSHTNADVPFYAYGLDDESIKNFTVIDNTDIIKIMKSFLQIENQEPLNIGWIITLGAVIAITVSFLSLFSYKKFKRLKNESNINKNLF
ncbi:MAG: alkaline phosphatase [Promethearchaeota archaeon]